MRVVFAGTPDFAAYSLQALLDAQSDVQVVAVYTQPDRTAGRGRQLQQSPVKQLALKCHIDVIQPEDFRAPETVMALSDLRPDLMVVTAYGLLLPQAVLDTPRLGCVNVHASLLPRWRGAAPIQRAIQAGDTKTGISLMQMEIGLDTGPVLATAEIDIAGDATGGSLHDLLAKSGQTLLADSLSAIAAGELTAVPQDDEKTTYAHKLEKKESRICWDQSAVKIERMIRAFDPWPGTSSKLDDMEVRIRKAVYSDFTGSTAQPGEVLQANKQGIVVQCGDGALSIQVIQKSGGKPLAVADFLNGVPVPAGARFH